MTETSATTKANGTKETDKLPTDTVGYLKNALRKKRGICMVNAFWEMEHEVRALDIKPDDIWVLTFPKSGTTWMQEAVWLLSHNLDYEGAKTLLKFRSPTLESCWAAQYSNRPKVPLSEFEENAARSGGRRVLKTHLHWEHLPQKLRDLNVQAKMIYVTRNPKDVCVSYYYFHCFNPRFRALGYSIEDFTEFFMSDVLMGPYWTHVKGYWAQRDRPNILFVKYEDMKKDLAVVLKKVATFLEVPVPQGEQMDKLVGHLSFESMKKNPALNRETGSDKYRNEGDREDGYFIRKGIVGDWKEKLSPQAVAKLDQWIAENTRDTDWTNDDCI